MPGPVVPIDYTNVDYDSMRAAMLDVARQSLPEWTDFSESDIGVLLVELFAHACDVTLYYQTRIAANLLPATADEPEALVQLLRLIGYEIRSAAPATANLSLAFDAAEPTPVVIPLGTPFTVALSSGEQLRFETERTVVIQTAQLSPPDSRNLRRFFPVPVVQGTTVTDDPVAVSDGSRDQMYRLRQAPVIAGSIQVVVTEPGGDATWHVVPTLAYSTPADRDVLVQQDAGGGAVLVFGDGINGMAPPQGAAGSPVTIKATYRVGGGPAGNVPARTRFVGSVPSIREAVNLQAAGGGTAQEDVDRARTLAPRLFRSQERAVTARDYTDLALRVPGVGKARAFAPSWNDVVLSIAPSGQVADPSELLTRDVLAFFEERRMATTILHVVGPVATDVYLRATVRAQPYYLQSDVRAVVEKAVTGYLAFDAVDFGQPVYLSRIYDVIQSLPQVESLTVTEFSRAPDGTVDADGVIDLTERELPRLGYRDNAPPGIPPVPLVMTIVGGVSPGGGP